MSDNWWDNPVEVDSWIDELEQSSKGGSGNKKPSNSGCGGGCLTAVIGIVGVIVVIAVILTALGVKV